MKESKTEIPLGQKPAVQIGTGRNWQAVSERNKTVGMVELVGIGLQAHSENRQVIESA